MHKTIGFYSSGTKVANDILGDIGGYVVGLHISGRLVWVEGFVEYESAKEWAETDVDLKEIPWSEYTL